MNRKIVVVDDDRVTLRLLEGILSKSEFMVLSARDGESGYEVAQKEKPDIVISDLVLPKVDGIGLCKKIKQDPNLKRTKVILMTAVYKSSSLASVIGDCQADEFIEKPIETLSLMKKVYKLCQEIAEAEEKEKPA